MSIAAPKNALIVGGGSGIGAAVALGLAEDGCNVAIAGRNVDRLTETARRYSGGGVFMTHSSDVTNPQDNQELVSWFEQEVGPIDILAFCAGKNVKHRSFQDTTREEWDSLMETNASGAFHCLKAVLPSMRERKDGLIVLISSISGLRSYPLGGVAYCASKFALSSLATTIANEERTNGIRVTSIFPGEVDTPMLDERPQKVTEEHRASILQPEDVAEAVRMVARLPKRANVLDITIKPTSQEFV